MSEKAKDAAMRLLNYADRTEAEMRERLRRKSFRDEEIEETIKFLYECGYLNDERYAELYVSQCISQGKGSIWISQRLKQKGIAREMIARAFEQLGDRDDEKEVCYLRALHLLGIADSEDNPAIGEKELAKIARRLAASGFPPSCIYAALKRIRRS